MDGVHVFPTLKMLLVEMKLKIGNAEKNADFKDLASALSSHPNCPYKRVIYSVSVLIILRAPCQTQT